jgi:hypothetical protein
MKYNNYKILQMLVAATVLTTVASMTIGSETKDSFADTSQGGITGKGCIQNDCPGASSDSPGNFPKIVQGDCEALGKTVNGGCNGASEAPGQIAKNPICSPDNGATFGCTANDISPGHLNR